MPHQCLIWLVEPISAICGAGIDAMGSIEIADLVVEGEVVEQGPLTSLELIEVAIETPIGGIRPCGATTQRTSVSAPVAGTGRLAGSCLRRH